MAGTILFVDDDRSLCKLLSKAFSVEGYRVVRAHDGQEALERFREHSPDLVILDLILPKGDGFFVLEGIRRGGGAASQTPVVLLSACTRSSDLTKRAADLGAVALLTKPVPLDALLDLVAEQMEKLGVPASGPLPIRRTETRAVLSGTLHELPFPALLHHVHGLRTSGVLHLRSGKKRKAIQLRDGYPVAVKSNLINECLGNLLLRIGHIDEDLLNESVALMKSGGQLQGEILVAMQVMSEEEIAEALRSQAHEKLFEIFSWSQGEFELKLGARLKHANALAVDRSPANLILQGVRERVPLSKIDAFLRANGDRFVVHGESPFYRFQDVDLDPALEALLRDLDGTRRLDELPVEGEEARRTVYGLLSSEMLEFRSTAAGKAAAPRRVVERSRGFADRANDRSIRQALATMAERFRRANYLEILGVTDNASDDQVREAYEQLAQRTHPDRFINATGAVRHLAEEVFGRVSRAYEALRHQHERTEYILEHRRAVRERAHVAEDQRVLDAEVAFQKGEAHLRKREYEDALRLFGRALEFNPEEGEHHAYYGWVLYLSHPSEPSMVEEAMEHVRRGAALARDHEKPYLFLGRLHKALGQTDAAEKMFTRAVQIQPDCVEALREIRLIRMRRQRGKGLLRRLFGR